MSSCQSFEETLVTAAMLQPSAIGKRLRADMMMSQCFSTETNHIQRKAETAIANHWPTVRRPYV